MGDKLFLVLVYLRGYFNPKATPHKKTYPKAGMPPKIMIAGKSKVANPEPQIWRPFAGGLKTHLSSTFGDIYAFVSYGSNKSRDEDSENVKQPSHQSKAKKLPG
jgi:hypothetical protein